MTYKEKLEAIRAALADYMFSEGCSCCQDKDAHDDAEQRLAKLLRVPPYPDGYGFDFHQYRTKKD